MILSSTDNSFTKKNLKLPTKNYREKCFCQ